MYRRRREVQTETLDVSSNGLFLRVSEVLPLRSLVRVRLEIPHRGALIAHAMVVHAVAVDASQPGLGLQFWGLNGKDRSIWDGFVAALARGRDKRERSGPIRTADAADAGPHQRRVQTK